MKNYSLTKMCFLAAALLSMIGNVVSAEPANPIKPRQAIVDKPLHIDPKSENMIRIGIFSSVEMQRLNGRLEELETFYQDIRRNRTRTHSGLWKLSVFYDALYKRVPKIDKSKRSKIYREAWLKHGEEWRRKYPKSPAAHIGHALQLLRDAWQIRGGGYAQDVWADDWKAFSEKVNEAAEILDQCRDFASIDPHWYSARIQVAKARGEGFEKIFELLTEAVSKEPYYYDNYHHALYAAQPRWGGSWQLIENLIDWSVEKTKAQEGTSMFAYMYLMLYESEPLLTEKLKDNQEFWPRIQKSISDKLKVHPHPHNLRHHGIYACRAKNKQAVRWILEERRRLRGLPSAYTKVDPAYACDWKTTGKPTEVKPAPPLQRAKIGTDQD